MKYVFHPEALNEYAEAVQYYRKRAGARKPRGFIPWMKGDSWGFNPVFLFTSLNYSMYRLIVSELTLRYSQNKKVSTMLATSLGREIPYCLLLTECL